MDFWVAGSKKKRFDRLTEEFDAQRLRIGSRKNIDDPPRMLNSPGISTTDAPGTPTGEAGCQGLTLDRGADGKVSTVRTNVSTN